MTMPEDLADQVGFGQPGRRERMRRTTSALALFAAMALAISLAIAVAAVSIGMARADTLGMITDSSQGTLGVAALVGALFAGMGIITALVTRTAADRRD
jgi:hypothetical protein